MSLSIKVNFATNSEIATMFGTISTFEQYKVGDRVVTAGSSVILKRAKELAPRDTKGHGAKRSKAQRRKARWNIPLHTTIKRKIVRADRGAYAIIGPSWPDGNKAYFNTGKQGRRVFYWGKDAGLTKLAIRNWIVQAADETRPAQLDAMKAKLQEAIGEVIRG
tara:strand:+ start:4376 stop:4864 length:489 start_codon:yes stop_codon:yes gene_type:complete